MDWLSADFFTALAAIIVINVVLSGDNAIVIALAARKLPKSMRSKAIIGGTAGAILLRMGKSLRQGEPAVHERTYSAMGVPILGRIEAPGTAEGGDCLWIDEQTLFVGRGFRTNASGMEQLTAILRPQRAEAG